MLTFDPDRHAYFWHGKEVPNVTKVMRAAGLDADLSHASPADVAAAALRGRWVHDAVQFVDEGDLDYDTVPGAILGYVQAYEKFLDESACRVLGCEEALYSPTWNVAGRCDKRVYLGRTRPRRGIIDVKTPASMPLAPVKIQLEAYRLLADETYPGEPIDELYALQLRPDGNYRLKPCDDQRARRVFCYATRAYREEATAQELDEIAAWRIDFGPRRAA